MVPVKKGVSGIWMGPTAARGSDSRAIEDVRGARDAALAVIRLVLGISLDWTICAWLAQRRLACLPIALSGLTDSGREDVRS